LSFAASGNYLINEYFDRKEDKNHPIKNKRNFVRKKYQLKKIVFYYLTLISISIFLSFYLPRFFFILIFLFILFGALYNLKPFRLKNFFLVDVIIESINLPIRYLMGWSLVLSNYLPPLSIIMFFYTFGCYLMTIKRKAEYDFLIKNYIKPVNYRKSFKHYSKNILEFLSWCYGLLSFFFISIFIIKYRIELIIIIPILVIIYSYYYLLSYKKNSLTMILEKIYLDKKLFILFFILLLLIFIAFLIDIEFLQIFTSINLIKLF
jgi:4-hydroxybenzoate polyprenyltransferase